MNDFSRDPVLLDVRNLSVDFLSADGAPVRALEDISLTLHEGELFGVVGESGCGKTTLMLSLMRLLPATGRIVSGQVNFIGQDLLALKEDEMADLRGKNIAMIFQGAMNALNPVRTIGDQIAEAIVRHNLAADKTTLDNRVSELLDLVGIGSNRKSQYPHQYSVACASGP